MGSYETNLLARLVEIDTNVETKKGYDDFVSALASEVERLAFKYQIFGAREGATEGSSVPSLVVDHDVGAKLTVAVAAHYDTVPPGEGWKHDPGRLTIEGDKAYGRGACDNKGDIVAGLGALKVLKEQGASKFNILYAVTLEEEVGGELGLGYLTKRNVITSDWAIVLDASPSAVGAGASGIVWGKVAFSGKQGHAGYPHTAKNPIDIALPVLNDLRKFSKERERIRSKLPAKPGSPFKNVWGRFSITVMNAGFKENVIPQLCEARFDMRVCPDESPRSAQAGLKKYFKKLLKNHGVKGALEFTKTWPSYSTNPRHPLVKKFTAAASKAKGSQLSVVGELAANDGHFFASQGIPTICFGVLRGDCRIHGIDEFVHLEDIDLVKNALINFFSQG